MLTTANGCDGSLQFSAVLSSVHCLCSLEQSATFKQWKRDTTPWWGLLQDKPSRRALLHRHGPTLLGAAYATAFFVLLTVLPLALGPSMRPAGMAGPAGAQQQAEQLQQAVRDANEAKRQQQDVTQQLLQAQAAATAADAASHSETARIQELLALWDAELDRMRQQVQEAKAAAHRQAADSDRASANTVKVHSEEIQRLQQQVDAERRERATAEGKAAAAEHSVAVKAAQQGTGASGGSQDTAFSSQPSAAGFMSPRWTLQRLMAQVSNVTDCYSHGMQTRLPVLLP
jgi:hypothetical protein